uniref:Uncharacterized protein n=1 Tax=Rhizophora mucronata TaxID=61149 RepID=A0A2P2PYT0_RHIMU
MFLLLILCFSDCRMLCHCRVFAID